MSEQADVLRDFSFDESETLQLQLYKAIKSRVLTGRIASETRLPSTRYLSTSLGVSRNTVSAAFEQLIAEGYLETRTGAGHFVATNLPDEFFNVSENKAKLSVKNKPLSISKVGQQLLSDSTIRRYGNSSFEAGLPDLKAFPIKQWGQIYHQQCQRVALLGYDNLQGSKYLREVLANYLRSSRGLDCDSEQIVITMGAQQAASIAMQVILDAGDEVYLENPGYIGMREAFKAHHCKITGIPVGKEGIELSALPSDPKGKLICLTPTHQYPMGGIMPLANRLKVLQWAAQHGIWVIEDDYDSEYHYDHKPIASIQGLGLKHQVIYIGSFSKVLYPALRLGYMVVPKDLVIPCVKTKNRMAGQSPMVEQETVAEFIAGGHFVRHLRKMRKLYHQKFNMMVTSCEEQLKGLATLEYTGAGMHIVLLLNRDLCKQGLSDLQIVTKMRENGMFGSALSLYYIKDANKNADDVRQGLVLGFTNTDLKDIVGKVRLLRDVIMSVLQDVK